MVTYNCCWTKAPRCFEIGADAYNSDDQPPFCLVYRWVSYLPCGCVQAVTFHSCCPSPVLNILLKISWKVLYTAIHVFIIKVILHIFKMSYRLRNIEQCYLPGKMGNNMHSHEKVIITSPLCNRDFFSPVHSPVRYQTLLITLGIMYWPWDNTDVHCRHKSGYRQSPPKCRVGFHNGPVPQRIKTWPIFGDPVYELYIVFRT
jgi:hypothetical protein